MYQQNQLVSFDGSVLLYRNSNAFQHNFINVTPGSDSFGGQYSWDMGSEFSERGFHVAKKHEILTDEQVQQLIENPGNAARILRDAGYRG
jgi:hypothetical protein